MILAFCDWTMTRGCEWMHLPWFANVQLQFFPTRERSKWRTISTCAGPNKPWGCLIHCFFLGCPVALPLVPICCVACWQPLFRSPHISLKFNDFTVRVLDTDRSTVDRMTWYLREQWMVYLWVYRLAHGGAVSTVMNGTCLFARLQVETLHISIQRMRKQSDVDRGRMCRIRISYGTAREQKCKYKIVNGWQGLFELDFGTKNTLSNIGNSLDI